MRDITCMVDISLSGVQFILKTTLNVGKINAKWVSYLLIDDQRKQWVKIPQETSQNIS